MRKGDNVDDLRRSFERFKSRIPTIAGTTAKNFFVDSWKLQGFDDGKQIRKWKPRSSRSPRNSGRAILVDSGRLRRSIRILKKSSASVTVGTTVPYGAAHNFGLRITTRAQVRAHIRRTRRGPVPVRAHSRSVNLNIPRRQFIGRSDKLNRQINEALLRAINRL